ncbi:FUSC family protein [Streptomyces sp. NBC_01460]|uniref:FUSC family protein n=1 Tax=Streptomyces sp. NBC_01460 TaxID=2903875 RepID=UPI002E30C866|nr:FUSC family protein [Streptomyces sp. NBC_01460]
MSAGPGRAAVLRRSLRVTLAASAGFYPLRYAADLPVAALYALFAPIAVGLLSAIPGSGRQQAFVTLRALPPALVLATLGTLVAVDTWAATGGMLVVGFLLAFATVAGPRPAGAAPGLQLFYILACFPPYAPETLGERLAGLVLGMLLLAAGEVLLPDPSVASYRERLANALGTASRAAAAGEVSPEHLRESGSRMRLSHIPPSERPAGAGRADRALEQGGRSVRRLLDQLATLSEASPVSPDPVSTTLIRKVAETCDSCAHSLRTGCRPPAPGELERAMRHFQTERRARTRSGAAGPTPSKAVLRRQSRVLALAESARIVEVTVDIAANGRPGEPPAPAELFWYAELSTPRLWARRALGNVTLRSVLFQNAVRTALGLAAARLVAGSLDLDHGFWVLLAVLTLGRTTVGETWQAVRRAVAGNAVGALVAGALLTGIGPHTDVYAALLAPAMLVGFSVGPMLGIACTQGLFTLVVATAFAQIAPATWRLSEARIIDVATGSAIGLLCGLLAWPAGARREVRRAMAALLRACGGLVPPTAEVLVNPVPGSRAVPGTLPTLHRLRLAEAAYAQYRTEARTTPGSAEPDWHAVLMVANHVLQGAHRLPRFGLRPSSGPSGPAATWARAAATGLDADANRIAHLFTGAGPRRSGPPSAPGPNVWSPASLSVDLEVWMTSLRDQFARIEASAARSSLRRSHGSRAPEARDT